MVTDGLVVEVRLRCFLRELPSKDEGLDAERFDLANRIAEELNLKIGGWVIQPESVTLPE